MKMEVTFNPETHDGLGNYAMPADNIPEFDGRIIVKVVRAMLVFAAGATGCYGITE
jgi:hypothetical protein